MPLILLAINALKLLVFADAVFSWLMPANHFPRSLTKPLLDPVYAPLRRVLHPLTGPVDLSPLIALAVLYGLQLWLERKRAGGAGAS